MGLGQAGAGLRFPPPPDLEGPKLQINGNQHAWEVNVNAWVIHENIWNRMGNAWKRMGNA